MFLNERKEIARFMRRLYRMGLTTTSGGNISLLCENHIIITPSALDKGRMKARQIAVMTMEGKNLTPDLKPTSEKDMHIEIYKRNSSVKSIVHAHPVTASAFACTNRSISTTMMAEHYAILGIPVRAKYATMGTMDLAVAVAGAAAKSSVIIMDNHGVLATGKTVLQAFDRIEVLESAAKTTLITDILQEKKNIPKSELDILAKIVG
ncbi:MAG: class II aldolase/adducin family protein [Bacteroides sp.]|nr:class II aldolase/adducin family protein [Bacteroides sp.]